MIRSGDSVGGNGMVASTGSIGSEEAWDIPNYDEVEGPVAGRTTGRVLR